jgi:hypothetical protein
MFQLAYSKLLAVGERYRTRSLTASEITKIIRRQFPSADFSFRTCRDYAVDPDMVVVAGIYDSMQDQQGLPCIEISLCYHPEQQIFCIDALDWVRLSFDIAECMGHELIHRQQSVSNCQFKEFVGDNEEQEYLGHGSEIEAYGYSIAIESLTFDKPYSECAVWQGYTNTFGHNHSVVLQLKKQIIKYLKQLEPDYEQTGNTSR